MSFRISALSLLALSALGGCEKSTATPDDAAPWVELDWVIETKLSHGKCTTTLPSGERFEGTYLNVTHDTAAALVQPYHAGWGEGFSAGAAGDAAAWKESQEGQVIGLLSGNQSTKMRCVLTLDMPDVGMEGGGEGTCELSTGKTLRARFGAK